MAKERDNSAERMAPSNAKLADIQTAAKSTMDAADYSDGYPVNPGTLHNKNYSGQPKGNK